MNKIGTMTKELGAMKKGLDHLVIFYFSGTGNSAKVVEWLSSLATERNIEVNTFDLSKIKRTRSSTSNLLLNLSLKPQTLSHKPYLLFIAPTHGFNYPPIMMHFLMRFPKGSNRVGLMNTRAGMRIGKKIITPGLSGLALLFGAFVLRVKGYSIRAMVPVDLPSNWVSVHPVIRDKGIRIIHRKMKVKVLMHGNRILNGEKDLRGLRDIIQDILISPIAILYYFIGRFFLAKTFIASPDCTNCGLCQKACGVGAIKQVNGRPFWTHKCESCMHCMSHCPEKAIQTCHGFVALLIILVTSVFLNWFYQFLESHFFEIPNQTIRFIVNNVLLIGFILIGYRINHWLMRFKWYGRIIEFTSLTRYKFWGKGYKALKDKEF